MTPIPPAPPPGSTLGIPPPPQPGSTLGEIPPPPPPGSTLGGEESSDPIKSFQKTYDVNAKPQEPSWWDEMEGKSLDIQRYAKESVKDLAKQYPLILPRTGKAIVSGVSGLGEMGSRWTAKMGNKLGLIPSLGGHSSEDVAWAIGEETAGVYRKLGDLVEGSLGATREDVQDLYTAKTGPGKVLQTAQELAPIVATAAVAPAALPALMGAQTTGETYRATEGAPEGARTIHALGQGGLATGLSYLPMGPAGEALGNKLLSGVIKSPVARKIAAGGLAVAGEAVPWEIGSNAITKATIDSKQPLFSPKGYAEKVLTFGALKIPHLLNAGWKPMDPVQYSNTVVDTFKALKSADPVPGEDVHDSLNRAVGTGKSIAIGLNRISETLQHVISPKEAETIQRWKENPTKVQLDPDLQQKWAEYGEPLEHLRDHVYWDVKNRIGEVEPFEDVQAKNADYVPRPVKGKGGFIDSIMEDLRKPLDLGGAFNEEIVAGQGGRILKEPEEVKHREIMTMEGPDGQPVVVKQINADEYVGLKNKETFIKTGTDEKGNPIWGVKPVSIKLKDGTKHTFEHPADVAEVKAVKDTLSKKIGQIKEMPMTTKERAAAIKDLVIDHDSAIKEIAKKVKERKLESKEVPGGPETAEALRGTGGKIEGGPRSQGKSAVAISDAAVGEVEGMVKAARVHPEPAESEGRSGYKPVADFLEGNSDTAKTFVASDGRKVVYAQAGDNLHALIDNGKDAPTAVVLRLPDPEVLQQIPSLKSSVFVDDLYKAPTARDKKGASSDYKSILELARQLNPDADSVGGYTVGDKSFGHRIAYPHTEMVSKNTPFLLRTPFSDIEAGLRHPMSVEARAKMKAAMHEGMTTEEATATLEGLRKESPLTEPAPEAKPVEAPPEKGFTLRQAKTDEIESQSNLRYHKDYATNLLSQVGKLTNYRNNLAMVQGLKKQGVKAPEGVDLPKGYNTTTLPDMKGMAFPKNIAKALDKVHIELQHGNKSIAQNIMRACTGSIFVNPMGHILNTGYHFTYAAAVNAALHPLSAGRYLPKDLLRAYKGIIEATPEAMRAMESGTASMSNPDLLRSVEANTRYALSRMENSAGIKEFAAKLGMAPADAIKGIYKTSQNVLWTVDDILRLTYRYQIERTHPSWSERQINHEVDNHIASYRWNDKTPTALIKIAQNKALAFTRYHSFLVKSLWELGKNPIWNQKGIADPQAARREAMFRVAALGLFGIVVKPALDQLLKNVTGEEKAEIPTAGPTSLLAEGIHVAGGTKRIEQALLTHLASFSPGFIRPLEALTNIDFYRRKDVASEEAPVVDRLKHLATAISPFSMYSQLDEGRNPKQFWLGQAGVRFKGTGSEQVWSNLRSKYSGMARQGPTERDASIALGKLKKEIRDKVDLNNPESIKENLGWMGPAAIKMFQSGNYSQKQLENLLKSSIQSRPMNLAYSMKASGASPEDIWKVYQHGETPEKIALAVVLEQKLLSLKEDSLPPKRLAKIIAIADSLNRDLLRPAMQDALRKIKEDRDFSALRLDEENVKAEEKE